MSIPVTVAAYDSPLKRLFWLRNASIALQILALVVANTVFAIVLPTMALASIIGILCLVNVFTAWRLKKGIIASDFGIFAELCADVLLLSAMLGLSGGAGNPFVSLYLLPLTIAATVLPVRYMWMMTGLTLAAYSVLLLLFEPGAGTGHAGHSDSFDLHVLGMWMNFVVSAALITIFVNQMARALRERDAELASARERELRDQQLVTLGTFAAGTAHELGTPLSTMAVILNDLDRGHASETELKQDLGVLRDQVDACKTILTDLVDRAGHARSEEIGLSGVRGLVSEAEARWRLMRPESSLEIVFSNEGPSPAVAADEILIQALVTLLNNAADASPEHVQLVCDWNAKEVILEVRDQGRGLTDHARQQAGRTIFSEKPGRGLGLGLLLARATIERVGGRIDWINRDTGGAAARVVLPRMKDEFA